jgi:hypothetical protein
MLKASSVPMQLQFSTMIMQAFTKSDVTTYEALGTRTPTSEYISFEKMEVSNIWYFSAPLKVQGLSSVASCDGRLVSKCSLGRRGRLYR